MAIYKSNILQATGAERITVADVDSVYLEPGLHFLPEVYTVVIRFFKVHL